MHVLVSVVQQHPKCRLLTGAHQRAQGLHSARVEKARQGLPWCIEFFGGESINAASM